MRSTLTKIAALVMAVVIAFVCLSAYTYASNIPVYESGVHTNTVDVSNV